MTALSDIAQRRGAPLRQPMLHAQTLRGNRGGTFQADRADLSGAQIEEGILNQNRHAIGAAFIDTFKMHATGEIFGLDRDIHHALSDFLDRMNFELRLRPVGLFPKIGKEHIAALLIAAVQLCKQDRIAGTAEFLCIHFGQHGRRISRNHDLDCLVSFEITREGFLAY